jgi:hypothetical protein
LLHKSTIRTFGAILLLLIFIFSATPKILLHNLVAHHKDTPSHGNGKTKEFAKAGYHCDCENLVVVLPYIGTSDPIQKLILEPFQSFQAGQEHQFYSFQYFIFGFRGPPVNS